MSDFEKALAVLEAELRFGGRSGGRVFMILSSLVSDGEVNLRECGGFGEATADALVVVIRAHMTGEDCEEGIVRVLAADCEI